MPAGETLMTERLPRLGDIIDDYCPRCKLLMNHRIQALNGDQVAKVLCNTCGSEHPYRHGRTPKRKDPVKAALDEVLGKIGRPPK